MCYRCATNPSIHHHCHCIATVSSLLSHCGVTFTVTLSRFRRCHCDVAFIVTLSQCRCRSRVVAVPLLSHCRSVALSSPRGVIVAVMSLRGCGCGCGHGCIMVVVIMVVVVVMLWLSPSLLRHCGYCCHGHGCVVVVVIVASWLLP